MMQLRLLKTLLAAAVTGAVALKAYEIAQQSTAENEIVDIENFAVVSKSSVRTGGNAFTSSSLLNFIMGATEEKTRRSDLTVPSSALNSPTPIDCFSNRSLFFLIPM